MKIAITSLIKNRHWIIQDFLDKIIELDFDKKDIYLIFLNDFSIDNSIDILKEFKESFQDEYAGIDIIENTKFFDNNVNSRILKDRNKLYEHLSYLRNLIIDKCVDIKADYQFSIDSDILVSNDILNHLLSFDKDYIASIILNDNHLLPKFDYTNLLNRYINASADLSKVPIHFKNYELNKLYKVQMSGACYLIKNNLFKYKFENHRFGEDAGYCLNIQEDKYLETTIKAIHIMEERYLEDGLKAFKRCFDGR
ncbi:MAG TPA: hypothetical protein PKI46_00195 [Bacteroidales bacterium]|nr:hypothetical protein [Bacteroidales bacterium]